MAAKKKRNTTKATSIIPTNNYSLGTILGGIASGLAILTFAFGAGRWVAGLEHELEIMEINQQHNKELSDLRIQMNNQIQMLQNKYDILEANYNLLLSGKEVNNEK